MRPEKPQLIKSPIAYNGDKRQIPAATPLGSNQLSFESGFPALTSTPLRAGGLPPDRLDFNAALNLLSTFTYFMQSGNQFEWNSELDYNPGAFVLGSDESLYFCTQANGATVPNTVQDPTSSTGYWLKVFNKQGVFNVGLIADGAITSSKIANNAITNEKVSDIDASKITGILPVAGGGNGTTTGISNAMQTALNAKQPKAQNAPGLGQVYRVSDRGFTVPAGGAWLLSYAVFSENGTFIDHNFTVVAGGASYGPYTSMRAYARGWLWRIA